MAPVFSRHQLSNSTCIIFTHHTVQCHQRHTIWFATQTNCRTHSHTNNTRRTTSTLSTKPIWSPVAVTPRWPERTDTQRANVNPRRWPATAGRVWVCVWCAGTLNSPGVGDQSWDACEQFQRIFSTTRTMLCRVACIRMCACVHAKNLAMWQETASEDDEYDDDSVVAACSRRRPGGQLYVISLNPVNSIPGTSVRVHVYVFVCACVCLSFLRFVSAFCGQVYIIYVWANICTEMMAGCCFLCLVANPIENKKKTSDGKKPASEFGRRQDAFGIRAS